MASCLYHPDDCESERTVIISELQGGENDPDQLLDQELTATAFKAHPYRHPTIGWLSDLQTMTRDDLYGYYRRYYVPNNATLVDRRRRRYRRGAAPRRAALRRASRRGRSRRGCGPSSRSRPASGALDDSQGGHDGVPEGGVPRAGGDRPAVLPAADPRRRADRREGAEPLVQLPRAAAAAQRAAVSRAGRARPRVERVRRADADRAAVPLHGVGRRRPRARRWRRSKRRCSRSSIACGATASPTPSSSRRRRSFARASCSTTTA